MTTALRAAGVGAAVAASMLVVGCGSSSGPAKAGAAAPSMDAVQQVTVTTTDEFRFEPAVIRVHRGKVRFTIVESGSYPHNLSFATLGQTSKTVTGNLGEQRTTFDVTFNSSGHFRFVCTYHSTAGMTGEVVVS